MPNKQKGKWDETSMKKAVDHVLSGKYSIREAAFHFSVPKSSLGDRVTTLRKGNAVKMTPTLGRFENTFNVDLENELVGHLKDLNNLFYQSTKRNF